jgi:hypothetical protein
MIDLFPAQVFHAPDMQSRSVWAVIEPRDSVTGGRVSIPLQVRLKDVAAEPIAARSGVYCFTDLNLPAANYTVQVRSSIGERARYFEAEKEFALAVVPVTTSPLKRNSVTIDLLPRPAYPFDGQATLIRGRLLKSSDASSLEAARIFLIVDSVDQGLRGQTDERGEFVAFFPSTQPKINSDAKPKVFKFTLRFEITGRPPHVTNEETVTEGTTKSVNEIKFPGT